MPFAFEQIALRFQVTDNSAKESRRHSGMRPLAQARNP
jgi:hypothetical protein